MAILNDLEILLGREKADALYASLFDPDSERAEAYEILAQIARDARFGHVRFTALLLKCDAEWARLTPVEDGETFVQGRKQQSDELYKAVAGYDEVGTFGNREALLSLMAELTVLGLRNSPISSPALLYLEDQYQETARELAEADKETAQTFVSLKNRWLVQNIELRVVRTALEKASEAAADTRQAFMNQYGREYLAERSQLIRMDTAYQKLRLTQENPGVDEAAIERMLGAGPEKKDKRRSRQQVSRPAEWILRGADKPQDTQQRVAEARSLMRRLAALTHPDKVRHLELSEPQRRKLDAIWRETGQIRAQRNRGSALAESVGVLERQLKLAQRILSLAPIDELDPDLVIPGDHLMEKVEWLEAANEGIHIELDRIGQERAELREDALLATMQRLVAAPDEAREAEKKAMLEKSAAYRRRAEMLEADVMRLVSQQM